MEKQSSAVCIVEEEAVSRTGERIPYIEKRDWKWPNQVWRKKDGPPGNQTPVWELGGVTFTLVKSVYGNAVTCKAKFYCWTNSLGQYSISDPKVSFRVADVNKTLLTTVDFGPIAVRCAGREYNIELEFPQQWYESAHWITFVGGDAEGDGC